MTRRRRTGAEPSSARGDREAGPAPSDPEGDASRGTVCAEGVPVCARCTWVSGVLAGADATWKEQQQHSSPHSPRMRQAMTHAPGSAGVYTRIDP
jgi:hypothetical protein